MQNTCRKLPTPAWETVCEAYDQAAEVPKLMELSDLWLNLELTLADIWRGEDPSEQMPGILRRIDTETGLGRNRIPAIWRYSG